MDIKRYVGNKIKEYRKKKNLSQTELGKVIGVNQNTITGYEKGEWEIGYDNLFKLAEFFDVTVDDFFPPTKNVEYKPMQNIKLVTNETKDLDYDDMMLIKNITEK